MNGRYIKKRIHVRIEHVTPSRCHEEFLRRCKANDEARHAAKVAGQPKPVLKRVPKGPRTTGFTLENVKMESITAIPYGALLKLRAAAAVQGGGRLGLRMPALTPPLPRPHPSPADILKEGVL